MSSMLPQRDPCHHQVVILNDAEVFRLRAIQHGALVLGAIVAAVVLPFFLFVIAAALFAFLASFFPWQIASLKRQCDWSPADKNLALYLRPFDADEPWNPKGLEYSIVSALANSGKPVVTIGRRGRSIPSTGALRLYVEDEGWQALVSDLIACCDPVVLAIGATDGIKWEMGELQRLCSPRKAVILFDVKLGLFPWTQMSRFESALSAVENCLPYPVPDEALGAQGMIFDDQWRPILIQDTELRALEGGHSQVAGLRPIFSAIRARTTTSDYDVQRLTPFFAAWTAIRWFAMPILLFWVYLMLKLIVDGSIR